MGIGDEIMATGDVARLYDETGKKVLVLDRNDRPRSHDMFRGNPKIWHPQEWTGRVSDHPIVRSGPGRRPYADYEAIERLGRQISPGAKNRKELRRSASRLCFVKDYQVRGGEIYLDSNERSFGEAATKGLGAFVVIEPNIKGRVPAKQWGVNKWQALADEMVRAGFQPVQIGPGAGTKLTGVRYIKTPSFRQGMAVMDLAESFVVPEGGLHHAFGALHKKGVALFAGRTPLNLSYPEQTTWYVDDRHAPCGMEHIDCRLCRRLWNELLVSQVLRMLTDL